MDDVINLNEETELVVSGAAIAIFDNSGDAPQKVVNREVREQAASKLIKWGDDNDLPQKILAELKKNSDLAAMLDLQARIMYTGGVDYELMDPITYQPLEKQADAEIEAFLKRNWMYPIQASQDFYKFFNFFPQFTLTNNRRKIKWLVAHPANWCRYALQDSNGKIKKCYVNANFPDAEVNDKETLDLPTIDPILDLPENLQKRNDGPHYIYGLSYPTGETFYSVPIFWGLKEGKWLELANRIPAFKLALMKNQVTVKYLIKFPSTYWAFRYQNWSKMSDLQKKEAKTKEIKTVVDYLQGEENAGKTLTTTTYKEPGRTDYTGIEITPIDDKIKDGVYLEDGVMAHIKFFTALGLDPAILGVVPGKGGSNRSGSDKREAITMYLRLIQMHIDLVLKPYDFVSEYNGWNNDKQLVRWFFREPNLATLDQVTPKKRDLSSSENMD